MLISLHVKNLALIEESEVYFLEGLNILTGETGASNFIIFGEPKTLSTYTSKAFIRRVYESNIMLRNSRAIKESSI